MSKQQKKKRKLAQRKKVQARFKKRVSEGKSGLTGGAKGDKSKGTTTIGNYREAQRQQVTDAATIRNLSKNLDTNALVARDNRMYGNTFPSGSIGISPAGRRQAAANRKAAANKAAAAKKEATRKSTFDPNRISSSFNTDFSGFANNAAKGFNTLSVANMLAPKGGLSSYYMSGNRPNMTFNQAMKLENSMQQQTGKFDPNKKFNLASYARAESNPFRGMPGYGTIKSLINPRIRNINYNRIKLGKTPLSMDKINPGGFQTAPTEGFRRLAPALGAFMPGFSIGSKLFNLGQTDSSLDKSLKNVDNVNVGGLSIGFNSPESTDVGARLGKFFTSVPGKVANLFSGEANAAETTAGGLNIGGGVDSGDAPQSKLGRVLTFGKNLIQQPKAALAYGADVANQLFSPRLADGTLTGNQDFAGNLPGDKGFDNRDVQIKSAVNNAMDSRFVQQYGENLGLPKNFKAQTKDALAALGENYQGATADRDGIYKGTSETLKNLSSDKRLAPIAKFLNQLGTDNENVTDADRNQKFSMMGFQTPFTNEQAADAITAFQPNVEGMPGLSRADRGLIQGSGGNRIISGKLTDIAREAITGNIGTGDSLGIEKGTPLTIGNMLDAGSTIASNLQQEGTLASKRSAEIGRLADKAGKITTPSLIKGLIPRFGGSGSFRPNAVSSLGGGATTLAAATPTSVEEVLPLPTTATQTGTDSGNLAGIMQNAYQNQMSLYGMNPNYFANIIQPRFNTRPRRFRQVFNRGYF